MNETFKRRRTRIGLLAVGLCLLFIVACLRLVELVTLDGPRLRSLAHSEHTSEVKLAAVRGPIVDRNGIPLALSAETRSVYARPAELMANSTAHDRRALAEALGLSPSKLRAELGHDAPFVWLARRIPAARARAAQALDLEGVGALTEYKRFYPEGSLAAGVVGMAGMDGQGLSGIELEYDRIIRGVPIRLSLYHDALGRPILDTPLELKSPRPGARLELTIDSGIQSITEHDLAREVEQSGARRGSAVVLDPFTGEVLAMANISSRPQRSGIPRDRLHNFAIQDVFEPGSTMKGLLGSIALSYGAINPAREIYCEEGTYRIGGRTIHDDSPHGYLDLGGILEVSSNIGAAKIAFRLGAVRFYRGLRRFGLGSQTGIDLPGEAAGLLSKPSTWDAIDLANHAFGQGIAVTAIQMASAYAAIANGGLMMRPYVLKAAYDSMGRPILIHEPQVLGRAITPAVAHEMNVLLRGVVNGRDGTGHLAQVSGYLVAGKTGTAQMVNPVTHTYYHHHLVSSFIGFVPANDPKLVILVVLEGVGRGEFGGQVAAPVFSEVASATLRNLDVPSVNSNAYDTASIAGAEFSPTASGYSDASAAAREDEGVRTASYSYDWRDQQPEVIDRSRIPDFKGLSLRQALALADRAGLNLTANGDGYVTAQSPAAGAHFEDSEVKVTLAPTLKWESAANRAIRTPAANRRRGNRSRRHARHR